MLIEDRIRQYIASIKSEDNMRRLLRISFLEHKKYKIIMDALLDRHISIADLDFVNISNKQSLDKFIDSLTYIKNVISAPTNEILSILSDKVDFSNLIKNIRTSYPLMIDFNNNIESNIVKIEYGKIDVVNYKNKNEFLGAFDVFYNNLTLSTKISNFSSTSRDEMKILVSKGVSNDINMNVYNSAIVDKFITLYDKLFSNFNPSRDSFAANYFDINEKRSNLFIFSNRSNFILNFSINNEYFIYYVNELIEIFSQLDGNMDAFKFYIIDELDKIILEKSNTLTKDLTKFMVYAYFLYKLDSKFNAPYICSLNIIQYVSEYKTIIEKTYELANQMLLTK